MSIIEVDELKSSKVRETIMSLVRSGQFKSGSRLPSERELSKQLRITQKTVRRGLESLVEEGIVVKKARVGNFVKSQRTNNSIAIILPDYMLNSAAQHPATPLFIGGVSRILARREYVVSTISYHRHQCWLDAGNIISNFRGVILCTQTDVTRQELEQFAKSGVSTVLLGSHPCAAELDLTLVDIEIKLTIAQLMDGLYKLGHRRIVAIDYADSPFRSSQEDLVKESCRRLDLEFSSNLFLTIPFDDIANKPNYKCLANLFESAQKPTAIIAPDEFVASELFRLCYTHNLRVPQDISIAARWDCLPHSHPVPLTAPDCITLATKAAETATELLLKLLAGEQVFEKEILLKSPVQWKRSTGPAPNL